MILRSGDRMMISSSDSITPEACKDDNTGPMLTPSTVNDSFETSPAGLFFCSRSIANKIKRPETAAMIKINLVFFPIESTGFGSLTICSKVLKLTNY